jgi:hypothetical protein
MTRDYLAEMYVAGILADAGWNIYFPRRDKGFDFIITKVSKGRTVIRPVQVKGKYPEHSKTNKVVFGFRGKLTAFHDEMVLAIPFFPTDEKAQAPTTIAYLPLSVVRRKEKSVRCEPAKFHSGKVSPRRDYQKFFDSDGLRLLELEDWRSTNIQQSPSED